MRVTAKLSQTVYTDSGNQPNQFTNGSSNGQTNGHANGLLTPPLVRPVKASYSFEFFPPKTSQGVQNLYDRMERMYKLVPHFVDVTWNAGGVVSDLTNDICATAQSVIGLETCMHITCTRMSVERIDKALNDARAAGLQNLLALRGDPPRKSEGEAESVGEPAPFNYARDLIKHIRDKHGDYFDIGVAGYPEGMPETPNPDDLIPVLKDKVDCGATFIVSQMFYDVDNFVSWVGKCREAGIHVPIIPGIMPISTHASFLRRANWNEVRVPQHFIDQLEPVKNDDAQVREVGTELVATMCEQLIAHGFKHLHFYTMNLERATVMVLDRLGLLECIEATDSQPLPWRRSLALGRESESVRPIHWNKRKESYLSRTQDWDEFPNGRWGDSRSPAFGDLQTYGVLMKQSSAKAVELWGHPATVAEVGALVADYVRGTIKSLPWSDEPISAEVDPIRHHLIRLNELGILTINCQPAVNGLPSNHPVHGWGPKNGFVYQKAYLELLVSPETKTKLLAKMQSNPMLTYYSVNNAGDLESNSPVSGPNAVTWGIYPGKEIIQPTIVEKISFLAWKDEAFRLCSEWSHCYDHDSPSRALLQDMTNHWYLLNIVHNDFQDPDAIFRALVD